MNKQFVLAFLFLSRMVLVACGLFNASVLHAQTAATQPAAELTTDHLGNIAAPGDVVTVSLKWPAAGESRSAVTIDLLNYAEKIVATASASQFIGNDTIQFKLTAPAEGFYYLQARLGSQVLARVTAGAMPDKSTAIPPVMRRFGTIAHLKGMDDQDRERMLHLISRCGIGWIREGFLWHQLEPARGQWQWDRYDDLVARARRHGVEVLPVLAYGSTWGNNAPATEPDDIRRRWMPDPGAWENYVRSVVTRYKPYVHAWEIWNEPNWKTYWKPKPDAVQYAEILNIAYRTAKQVDPDCTVISAGLAPGKSLHPNDPSTHAVHFIRAMYALSPRPFDAFGYHPYTIVRPTSSTADMESRFDREVGDPLGTLHELNAGPAVPLWFTELGLPTVARMASESRAADYLAIILTRSAAMSGVQGIFWYNFRNVGINPEEKEDMFGLLHIDYTPKPGYFAYRTFIQKIGNASFIRRTQRDDLVLHEFTDADRRVIVAWASDKPTSITLPVASATWCDVVGNSTRMDSASGSVSVPVTTSPVYIEYASR